MLGASVRVRYTELLRSAVNGTSASASPDKPVSLFHRTRFGPSFGKGDSSVKPFVVIEPPFDVVVSNAGQICSSDVVSPGSHVVRMAGIGG